MALVGDIIMEMRSQGPDAPQVLQPLFNAPTLLGATTAGGNLIPGTYTVTVTSITAWGETTAMEALPITIAGPNNSIQVTARGHTGTVKYRAYLGGSTLGTEDNYTEYPTSPFVILDVGTPGTPPVQNRAYLPDTDGGFISAFTAFRWLNEALQKAAIITGGIQDWGGAGSTANQPSYRPATGVWRRFDAVWYDGWELEQGNKAEIFRNRPLTASISRIFAVDVNSAKQVVELYYIPSRTSATTTTSAILNSTDSVVSLTSAAGFSGPPFGLVQIGSELCFYASVAGLTLTGLTRALSGTVSPTSLAAGAPVRELNILWNGFRMPVAYSPGQSTLVLDVPQGWETILPKYLLAKFREAEQSRQEAAALFKEFDADFISMAKSNRQLAGPRQARIFDSFGFRGVIPASAGGGLIIR